MITSLSCWRVPLAAMCLFGAAVPAHADAFFEKEQADGTRLVVMLSNSPQPKPTNRPKLPPRMRYVDTYHARYKIYRVKPKGGKPELLWQSDAYVGIDPPPSEPQPDYTKTNEFYPGYVFVDLRLDSGKVVVVLLHGASIYADVTALPGTSTAVKPRKPTLVRTERITAFGPPDGVVRSITLEGSAKPGQLRLQMATVKEKHFTYTWTGKAWKLQTAPPPTSEQPAAP